MKAQVSALLQHSCCLSNGNEDTHMHLLFHTFVVALQQYWKHSTKPWRFMPPAEIAEAFANHPVGRVAAEELDRPIERTEVGASFCEGCAQRLASLTFPCACTWLIQHTAPVLHWELEMRAVEFPTTPAACSHTGRAALVHKKHALSLWRSLKACMRRETTLMSRHRVVYLYRILQMLIVAFCCATFFIRTHLSTSTLEVSEAHALYGATSEDEQSHAHCCRTGACKEVVKSPARVWADEL